MTCLSNLTKRTQAMFILLLWLCVVPAHGADPGTVYPPGSEVSDHKPGSILFYNFYTSSASSNTQNTQFSLTNTSTVSAAFVHLFLVADSGQPADFFVCLAATATRTFLASDVDPGVSGFMVAVAVDGVNGCPLSFNFLSGEATIKLTTGHQASLGAEAFAALYTGVHPGCDSNSVTATLTFTGTTNFDYNRAPRMLAIDKLRSRADGNETLLVLNRFGGNLQSGNAGLFQIAGVLYNDQAAPFTFSIPAGAATPQVRTILSNTFPVTSPGYESVIPAGRLGWMKLYPVNDSGMLGAVLNFNANAGASANAFNGGRNLRKLTFTTSATYTMPVFPPDC
jgi:hypothetical protein